MKRLVSLILICTLVIAGAVPVFGHSALDISNAVTDTAKYIYSISGGAGVSDVGGEWAVLGLARSGYSVPDEYYQNYYANVESYVESKQGVLHKRKYTEYSRVSLALTAIGKDPRNVGGYNLLTPLGDFDKTVWQGINGPTWALIALDSGNYPMPVNSEAKVQASRQMYVDYILSRQLSDGGWSLTGGTNDVTPGDERSDIDLTAMVLQALAKYTDQPAVAKAVDTALNTLSSRQHANGGFDSWGTVNSESCVQVVVALGELGIPVDDARFVKNGKTMIDNLLTNFYIKGSGFKHTADTKKSNGMATEQAFYGMVSANRQVNGQNSLYRMSDHITFKDAEKDDTVKPTPTKVEVTFSDIDGNKYKDAILEMASLGFINGMGDGKFAPNSTMTRAQFATIVTKSLKLDPGEETTFKDVPAGKWYTGYIATACKFGIVSGRSADVFDPEGLITRQEAAVMVANAAKTCSMNTALDETSVRNTLAQFGDYMTIAGWAKTQMAFCYANDIYDQSDLDTNPTVKITRGEIAQMLYNMLTKALVI